MSKSTFSSTYFEKNIDQNTKSWHIIDAKGQTLGRLATTIANLIRGKHKPTFTPHVDSGDFVVVVNAAEVNLTGNKLNDKLYYDHTGFVGGLKIKTAADWLKRRPEELIERAVWGMIPKGKLGRQQITKLKVYPGAEHPHGAQSPKPWVAPVRKSKSAVTA
jgi:large subunit ribosomal protein L13